MTDRIDRMQQILDLARTSGVVSAAEVQSLGIHSEYLRRLCDRGKLIRIGHGLYELQNGDVTSHHGLAVAAKAVPNGVICLLSALRFHEIGTEAPRSVWMAIDRRMRVPQATVQNMRFVFFSGDAFTEGVDEHSIEGIRVRVYNPAKTVADCFKYRNKIGRDVALDALREVMRERTCSVDELWKYAKICRVTKTMLPYMEALV